MFSPVVTAEELRRVERQAIQNGCSEEAFMLEAGRKIAFAVLEWIEEKKLPKRVCLLVGKGNNGGDAFTAGIELLQKGIFVRAYTLYARKECSILNQKFSEKFQEASGIIESIENPADLNFEGEEVILDGFLGTGFQGKVEPKMAASIAIANESGKPIFAIDIPSGLDGTTGEVRGIAIQAFATLSLGRWKSGFFLRDGWNHVGRLQLLDFGLPEKFAGKAEKIASIPDLKSLASIFPRVERNRHKYQAGYLLGISGSKKFRGAPKLAGLAALRSGSGIVRIFSFGEIGEVPYSLISQKWELKEWKEELKRAGAVFIGPGIGDSKKVLGFLKRALKNIKIPVVIDADAIQKGIEYPENAILTPHRGEVLRLLGISKDTREEDLLGRCQKWVNLHSCILVLKGAPTWVFYKGKAPVIIPRGDPGMAKAGAGDVLTGIIGSFLAQKIPPLHAAILGCSVHGASGESASRKKTSFCMIAEDLIDHLPHAIVEHRQGMVHLKPIDEAKDSLF